LLLSPEGKGKGTKKKVFCGSGRGGIAVGKRIPKEKHKGLNNVLAQKGRRLSPGETYYEKGSEGRSLLNCFRAAKKRGGRSRGVGLWVGSGKEPTSGYISLVSRNGRVVIFTFRKRKDVCFHL